MSGEASLLKHMGAGVSRVRRARVLVSPRHSELRFSHAVDVFSLRPLKPKCFHLQDSLNPINRARRKGEADVLYKSEAGQTAEGHPGRRGAHLALPWASGSLSKDWEGGKATDL